MKHNIMLHAYFNAIINKCSKKRLNVMFTPKYTSVDFEKAIRLVVN